MTSLIGQRTGESFEGVFRQRLGDETGLFAVSISLRRLTGTPSRHPLFRGSSVMTPSAAVTRPSASLGGARPLFLRPSASAAAAASSASPLRRVPCRGRDVTVSASSLASSSHARAQGGSCRAAVGAPASSLRASQTVRAGGSLRGRLTQRHELSAAATRASFFPTAARGTGRPSRPGKDCTITPEPLTLNPLLFNC